MGHLNTKQHTQFAGHPKKSGFPLTSVDVRKNVQSGSGVPSLLPPPRSLSLSPLLSLSLPISLHNLSLSPSLYTTSQHITFKSNFETSLEDMSPAPVACVSLFPSTSHLSLVLSSLHKEGQVSTSDQARFVSTWVETITSPLSRSAGPEISFYFPFIKKIIKV